MRLKGKRVMVVGLGRSGTAAVRFLVGQGARVTAADLRPREALGEALGSLQGLPVRLHFGGHPDSLLLGHDLVVPSPGVPWDLPALKAARSNGTAVWGELELAAGFMRGRVVGVTGTNGKTTTVSLIHHLLRAAGVPGQVAGNIGTPVLEIAEGSRPGDWTVLELSSFQLEASRSFRCHVAVVLNVTPDHLDRHHRFEDYVSAKARILANQQVTDTAVLNAEDPHCRRMADRARGRVVRFSPSCRTGADACVHAGRIVFRGADFGGTDLPLKGVHNLENTLAAVSACSLAGVRPAHIRSALPSFRPVPHRMEFVARIAGVDYFNDSKATNVAAALKACGSFRSGLWAILGGRDKGADFSPLAEVLETRTRAALLVGEAASEIRPQLGGAVPIVECGTVGKAVEYAAGHARQGDTVLLAPACASFDQYANYEERGREFRDIVNRLED